MTKFELVKKQLKDAMITEIKLKKLDLIKHPEKNSIDIAISIKKAMRTIISMFPELNKKKADIIDEDIELLCKKIIKSEKLRMLYQDKYLVAKDVEGKSSKEVSKIESEKLIKLDEKLISDYITIFENFLPQMITEEEIFNFIKNNIDFSKLKNKMQAIGIIKKEYGNKVDAKLVKDIVQQWK